MPKRVWGRLGTKVMDYAWGGREGIFWKSCNFNSNLYCLGSGTLNSRGRETTYIENHFSRRVPFPFPRPSLFPWFFGSTALPLPNPAAYPNTPAFLTKYILEYLPFCRSPAITSVLAPPSDNDARYPATSISSSTTISGLPIPVCHSGYAHQR